MRIEAGDKVKILSGKDRGKISTVSAVIEKGRLIVVEGVNVVKKHVKKTNNTEGGIVDLTKPISGSRAMVVCPKCGKPARINLKQLGAKKIRVCQKCQAEF